MSAQGPLAGLRIVEMDGIGPIPLAAMLLAEMGAEIIHLARPPSPGSGSGADARSSLPHRSRSVAYIDLKSPSSRLQVLDLVAGADRLSPRCDGAAGSEPRSLSGA